MNYELLLAARMACGNTVVERELREDYLAAIVDSYGSTNGTSTAETWVDADDIATEIDAVVAERENFEHGEVPPSDEAVHVMKQILHAAEGLGHSSHRLVSPRTTGNSMRRGNAKTECYG